MFDKRQKAIALRKGGSTYAEILKEVPVAKSTISLWLRDINLSKQIRYKITEKKRLGALRGAKKRKENRTRVTEEIFNRTKNEIDTISKRDLWFVGTALYWAEGSKEKAHKIGSGVRFSNHDPRMIRCFLIWLNSICNITPDRIFFEIYVHENHIHRLNEIREYWSFATGFSKDKFKKIYFKKHSIKTNRKNIDNLYYGGLRVKVSRSSLLNRTIAGWVNAIDLNVKNWGIV